MGELMNSVWNGGKKGSKIYEFFIPVAENLKAEVIKMAQEMGCNEYTVAHLGDISQSDLDYYDNQKPKFNGEPSAHIAHAIQCMGCAVSFHLSDQDINSNSRAIPYLEVAFYHLTAENWEKGE